MPPHGRGGQRVAEVVDPRDRQARGPAVVPVLHDAEAGATGIRVDLHGPELRSSRKAVGVAGSVHSREEARRAGIVGADDGARLGATSGQEPLEGVSDPGVAAVDVQVIGFQVRHHRDVRLQG